MIFVGSVQLDLKSHLKESLSFLLNHDQQAESLKKTVPAKAWVFIWYLNKVNSILNDLKMEKDLNI